MQAPEIIGVHIPRTAGTTFQLVLESVYGRKRTTTPEYREFRPTDALLRKICAANQADDVELYERALELRRSTIAGRGSEAARESRV